MAERKIFAGPRMRRVRGRLGLSQTEMAARLGISPSYLNLIERNQRPLTVQVLLKLANSFDIDIADLHGEGGALDALREVFSDPLIAGELPSQAELAEMAEAAPNAAHAIARLHAAYREALGRLSDLSQSLARDGAAPDGAGRLPVDRVAAWFEGTSPWFPELEVAAEALSEALMPRDDPYGALRQRLRDAHGVDVRVLPVGAMPTELARFDRHSQRLFLSERVPLAERPCLVARQIALLGERDLLDRLTRAAGFTEAEAARLCRLAFARRLAEAILLPASRLEAAARELRFDVSALARRFSVRPSRVMARLAALGGRSSGAMPLALVSLEGAGAVLHRLPGAGFPLPRFGALCGRLPAFDGAPPGRVVRALVALPDDSRFVMVAVAEEGPALDPDLPPPRIVTAIGMRAEDAAATIYAPRPDEAARGIGVTCRLCERAPCAHRAAPPVTRPAAFLEYVVDLSDHARA